MLKIFSRGVKDCYLLIFKEYRAVKNVIFKNFLKFFLIKGIYIFFSANYNKRTELFLGSSMAEHSAVNRRVVGSSPTRGAIKKRSACLTFFVA